LGDAIAENLLFNQEIIPVEPTLNEYPDLHRKGVGVEHIMRLGGWETLDIVVRYTRSVKFEDKPEKLRGGDEGLLIRLTLIL
jgi:hypothetical protein